MSLELSVASVLVELFVGVPLSIGPETLVDTSAHPWAVKIQNKTAKTLLSIRNPNQIIGEASKTLKRYNFEFVFTTTNDFFAERELMLAQLKLQRS